MKNTILKLLFILSAMLISAAFFALLLTKPLSIVALVFAIAILYVVYCSLYRAMEHEWPWDDHSWSSH